VMFSRRILLMNTGWWTSRRSLPGMIQLQSNGGLPRWRVEYLKQTCKTCPREVRTCCTCCKAAPMCLDCFGKHCSALSLAF
jgi:hypothetical protein